MCIAYFNKLMKFGVALAKFSDVKKCYRKGVSKCLILHEQATLK